MGQCEDRSMMGLGLPCHKVSQKGVSVLFCVKLAVEGGQGVWGGGVAEG